MVPEVARMRKRIWRTEKAATAIAAIAGGLRTTSIGEEVCSENVGTHFSSRNSSTMVWCGEKRFGKGVLVELVNDLMM